MVAVLSVMVPCCNSWSQNRSKEGLVNKPYPCGGEETKNEAKSMRETYIEIVHPMEREHPVYMLDHLWIMA